MADIQDAVYMRVQFHSDDVSIPITWAAQDASLTANFGAVHEIHTGDVYDGDYLVIPKTSPQLLETKDKMMLDDVTVTAIPYWETHNPDGMTVYIANEV